MAKDPRFNFYPDNWDGGTEDFTLEQEAAYLRIIIMQSRRGRFTKTQGVDCLMRKTRGNAAACAGLWAFLLPKFKTDGKVFWSERLEKEIEKSKTHSIKQKERADKRWHKNGIAAAMPVGNGIGIGSRKDKKEIEKEIFEDTIFLEGLESVHKGDLRKAFGECWNHHSNSKNPPTELWEWKQKLNSWLSIKGSHGGGGKKPTTNSFDDISKKIDSAR